MRMWKTLLAATAVAAAGALAPATSQAQDKTLTLCWAAWDPANALVELSKDFTAKTGIQMKFEFVPWTSYADRFLNELNSHGKLCDLIIGDSQWIGGAAENGHYVKLNDFFDKNGIKMDGLHAGDRCRLFRMAEEHARTTGRCRPWAMWSAGPIARTGSRGPRSRPSSRRSTAGISPRRRPMTELKQIAEFFQGRQIDGKKVYGAVDLSPSAAPKASPWA